MSGSFFKGTSLAQDPRFGDVTQKLASETTFNKILKKRVDMSKVNTEAIKPWLSYKINNVLGIDDEVLFEYILNMLEESDTPDGKAMQVNLTGFMESKAGEFMQDLWTVLLEAQKGPGGIPESFIRGKVEEIKKERVEQVRMKEAIKTADARVRDGASSRDVAERRTRNGRKSRWDTPAAPSSPSPSRNRDQDKSRDRSRDRDQDRSRYRERNRSRDRDYDRSRDRDRGRDRDYDRSRDRDHRRQRYRSTSPAHDKRR
ncbi:Serine/arginine repetitive matrix protein 1 [Coemansia aciculifera]|nr:Serine/arginine repetitive matrix protein 1 [Coemansia aciculifera]